MPTKTIYTQIEEFEPHSANGVWRQRCGRGVCEAEYHGEAEALAAGHSVLSVAAAASHVGVHDGGSSGCAAGRAGRGARAHADDADKASDFQIGF